MVITKPDSTTESLDVFGSSFTVYNVENPPPGVWKACVQTGTLTQSLSVSEEIKIQNQLCPRGHKWRDFANIKFSEEM